MEFLVDALIAPVLLGLLFLGQEIGYRARIRAKLRREESGGGQVGAVQGAVLGLLGLMLGFSFAGAAARFIERQDLIVREANAIGTAYLRADALQESHRTALQRELRDYTEHRLRVSKSARSGFSATISEEVNALHARIWKAAIEGTRGDAELGSLVLPTVNEVIDTHSLRIAAGKKHLPLQIMGLLLGCSFLAMGIMGYGSGLSGKRAMLFMAPLCILIATALWTTIDLDHPRAGFLRLSDAPLQTLKLE